MTPRPRGRPKAKTRNARQKAVSIRASVDELDRWREAADRRGVTLAEIAREAWEAMAEPDDDPWPHQCDLPDCWCGVAYCTPQDTPVLRTTRYTHEADREAVRLLQTTPGHTDRRICPQCGERLPSEP